MGKVEKKRLKLQERIDTLEKELINALTKKDSNTKEINVGEQQRKIQELRNQLKSLE
jgi:hypothetical protein